MFLHAFLLSEGGGNVRSYSKTIPGSREMLWRKSTRSIRYKERRKISNESVNSLVIEFGFFSSRFSLFANYADLGCCNYLPRPNTFLLDSHINSSYHGITLIIADIRPIFNRDYKNFVEFPYLHVDHVDDSDRSTDRSLWVTSGIGFMSYRVWN